MYILLNIINNNIYYNKYSNRKKPCLLSCDIV